MYTLCSDRQQNRQDSKEPSQVGPHRRVTECVVILLFKKKEKKKKKKIVCSPITAPPSPLILAPGTSPPWLRLTSTYMITTAFTFYLQLSSDPPTLINSATGFPTRIRDSFPLLPFLLDCLRQHVSTALLDKHSDPTPGATFKFAIALTDDT